MFKKTWVKLTEEKATAALSFTMVQVDCIGTPLAPYSFFLAASLIILPLAQGGTSVLV